MAMTAPAMLAASSASQPQTLEEEAEVYHADYGSIKDTLSRNRALTLRNMGPYFRSEILHERLIPRFALATREDTNQATAAEALSRTAANLWHSLLYTTEDEIPRAVRDILVKFGVAEPSDDHVILTAVNFATMLKYCSDDQDVAEEADRVEYFKTHLTVYPPAFRKMFNSVTPDLTRHSELILGNNFRRGRVPIDGYDHPNDSMYSNTFLYQQRDTYINITNESPPLAYLKEISTGQWRVTVGIGPGGTMICASSPCLTPVTPS